MRLIFVLKAGGLQDTAEIKDLHEKFFFQAMVFQSLQTQVEQLEMLSRTQASLGLAAFPDNLNALCRLIDRMKEGPTLQPPYSPSLMGDVNPSINIVLSSASPGGRVTIILISKKIIPH